MRVRGTLPQSPDWPPPKRTHTEAAAKSRHDLFDDVAMHVGQPHVAAAEAEGGLRVIQAEQVQHGCVQVMDFLDFLDGVIAEFIRRTERHAVSGNAAACRPARR